MRRYIHSDMEHDKVNVNRHSVEDLHDELSSSLDEDEPAEVNANFVKFGANIKAQ